MIWIVVGAFSPPTLLLVTTVYWLYSNFLQIYCQDKCLALLSHITLKWGSNAVFSRTTRIEFKKPKCKYPKCLKNGGCLRVILSRYDFKRRSRRGRRLIFNNVLQCNEFERHEHKEGITDWSEKTEWATQYRLSCKRQ